MAGVLEAPQVNVQPFENIRVCERCKLRYDWRKSPSTTLKMTYCSSLCEKADLGYTIEALLRFERGKPAESPEVEEANRLVHTAAPILLA